MRFERGMAVAAMALMEESVTRVSRPLHVPGAAWVAAGCALTMHALALGWAPTLPLAIAQTALATVFLIAVAISLGLVLMAIEARVRKPIPLRLMAMMAGPFLCRLDTGDRTIVVEPLMIDVPVTAWLHFVEETLIAVPVILTVGDLLGIALRGRGTVAMRMSVIAAVCGLTGITAGAYLIWDTFSVPEAAEFDRWVGGGAVGVIVLAATAAVAMRAASRVLPEARDKSEANYRILKPIASGGMGEVFLAERVGPHGFHRAVVLKRILAADENDPISIQRFWEEARIAASLQHPNIVAVNDLGRLDEGWFLAMEYLAGLSMRELLVLLDRCGARCPTDAIASIGLQAAKGLSHAHAHGVIHRDISPHNLMVTFEGVVKVLDFGVAKMKNATRVAREQGARNPTLTRDGVIVGKVNYLAPEQFLGKPASAAGDVFALGVALYELASGGRHPYGRIPGKFPVAESPEDRIPLCELREDLPLPLCLAIDRALGFDAWNRWRSASELANALAHARPDAGRFDLGAWIRSFAPPDAESLTPPNGTSTMPFAARA